MTNNVFENNFAIYGGGGIYFKNKILDESPYKFNTFRFNKASFANDFYTFPIRVYFQDDNKFKSWVNKSGYRMTIVPGTSKIKLNFYVVEFYGQTVKTLNMRFIFSLKYILDAIKKLKFWRFK